MSIAEQEVADAMIESIRASAKPLSGMTRLLYGSAVVGIAGVVFVALGSGMQSLVTARPAPTRVELRSPGVLVNEMPSRTLVATAASQPVANATLAHVASPPVTGLPSVRNFGTRVESRPMALARVDRTANTSATPALGVRVAAPPVRDTLAAQPVIAPNRASVDDATNVVPVAVARTGAVSTAPTSVNNGDELTRQSEALARSFALLASSPADALAQLDAFDAAFPVSQLRSERDFIAFDAMRRLGRNDEARRRGAALLTQFPRSMYAPRVRRLLEQLAAP
jgi:hypothetical protein